MRPGVARRTDRGRRSCVLESTVRIAFVLAPLLACASSDPPPPKGTPAAPAEAAPETPATSQQPAASPDVGEIKLSCVSGPIPGDPDGRFVLERIVEVRHDFAMVRTRMNKPPHRAMVQTLSADEQTKLRGLGAGAFAGPRPKASPPVPDGTACKLSLTVAGETIEEAVDPSPPAGVTGELVNDLRRRMTSPEPTWPTAKDPEIDQCRKAAQDPNVARFTVDEIVIEQDGTHRWMFLDDKEPSTANHFGCRIKNGKALILPEG